MKLLQKVLCFIVGLGVGHVWGSSTGVKQTSQKEKYYQELSDKHLGIMLLMNRWLIIKQEGKSVSTYFDSHGIKKIAIYGFSYVGNRLYDELINTDIEIVCIIDKKADMFSTDVEVYTPNEELPEVDTIVVSSPYYYDSIENQLRKVTKANIVSIEDILYEL